MKKYSIGINVVFVINYIYFIIFYSQGTDVQIKLPSKLTHFLFQSEAGVVPLIVFSLCLIVVAVLSLALNSIGFSKVTTVLCGLGFIPALAPIACNIFFGSMIDEKSDIIWLAITVFLVIYLILFQTFFIRDYKRIGD